MQLRPIDPETDGGPMTWQEFVEAVDAGALIDEFGHGLYATASMVSDVRVLPSEVQWAQAMRRRPRWATHVVWQNS